MYNVTMKQIIIGMLFLLLLAACSGTHKGLVGADRDKHGCIGSAGYTWSKELGKCIRPWEQKSVENSSSHGN